MSHQFTAKENLDFASTLEAQKLNKFRNFKFKLLVGTKGQIVIRILPELDVMAPGMNSASGSSLSPDTFSETTLPSESLRKWDKRIRITKQSYNI